MLGLWRGQDDYGGSGKATNASGSRDYTVRARRSKSTLQIHHHFSDREFFCLLVDVAVERHDEAGLVAISRTGVAGVWSET